MLNCPALKHLSFLSVFISPYVDHSKSTELLQMQ